VDVRERETGFVTKWTNTENGPSFCYIENWKAHSLSNFNKLNHRTEELLHFGEKGEKHTQYCFSLNEQLLHNVTLKRLHSSVLMKPVASPYVFEFRGRNAEAQRVSSKFLKCRGIPSLGKTRKR
jgi:hypothetical protein